ncbi:MULTISPECIES: nucleotidyltransferase-like protein [Paenibacillus]|uniref:nucleotidyltransferase-like protein n=1 Tax=Paenibacillus TaxID=44249 RepID=UPI00048FB80C|nr:MULTISPECIES: nucleotidyltransferase-like protein [Paenibacillus]MDU0329078.1 nucleotidyltransferase-like protein [Paenibacillus sp. 3LSP]
METTIFSILDEEKAGHGAIGAVGYHLDQAGFHDSLLHDFEYLIMVVHHGLEEKEQRIEHGMSGNSAYQLLHVGTREIELGILTGDQRDSVKYFLHGEIIWDIDGKLTTFRSYINKFGDSMKERRKLKEFAKFLKVYGEAKRYTAEQDLLDAYYCVLQALKHYARLELIEQGILPESSVWEQVRPLNSVVNKLFDELTENSETLEQRIQLVLLACEFTLASKMADCCELLLRILGSRKEAWSIQELVQNPELEHVRDELPLLLRKLVARSLAQEITKAHKEGAGERRELRYRA